MSHLLGVIIWKLARTILAPIFFHYGGVTGLLLLTVAGAGVIRWLGNKKKS